ncbi:MAG TPA: transcriptional regulator, partial [Prolixibacteraceae bacterium]|nr:transcriptional regulator [Prolixibacteraceae bacterium]
GLVDGLVESQLRIVELIKNNPKISKKSMAEQIGISHTSIDKHIKTLKDKQIIKRVGGDRNGLWQLIDNKK